MYKCDLGSSIILRLICLFILSLKTIAYTFPRTLITLMPWYNYIWLQQFQLANLLCRGITLALLHSCGVFPLPILLKSPYILINATLPSALISSVASYIQHMPGAMAPLNFFILALHIKSPLCKALHFYQYSLTPFCSPEIRLAIPPRSPSK